MTQERQAGRISRPVAEALAAFGAAAVIGLALGEFEVGTTDVGRSGQPVLIVTQSHQAVLGAVAAVAAPLLARRLRPVGGGWAVVAVGLVIAAAGAVVAAALASGRHDYTVAWWSGGLGLGLGGLLAAVAQAPPERRWGLAFGLAAGLPLGWWVLEVAGLASGVVKEPGIWLLAGVVGAAVILAVAAAMTHRRSGRGSAEDRSSDAGPAGGAAPAGRSLQWPVWAVVGLAAAALGAGLAHRALVERLLAPPVAEVRRIVSVDGWLRAGVVLLLGAAMLALVVRFARRHGVAASVLVRWLGVAAGAGVALLVSLDVDRAVQLVPVPWPVGVWLLAAVVIAGVLAGMLLVAGTPAGSLPARVPWDAIGLLTASAGLALLVSRGSDDLVWRYLLAAGVGLALGAGLSAVLAGLGAAPRGVLAVGLSLGMATPALLSGALAPFAWSAKHYEPAEYPLQSWPYTAAVLVAATAVLVVVGAGQAPATRRGGGTRRVDEPGPEGQAASLRSGRPGQS